MSGEEPFFSSPRLLSLFLSTFAPYFFVASFCSLTLLFVPKYLLSSLKYLFQCLNMLVFLNYFMLSRRRGAMTERIATGLWRATAVAAAAAAARCARPSVPLPPLWRAAVAAISLFVCSYVLLLFPYLCCCFVCRCWFLLLCFCCVCFVYVFHCVFVLIIMFDIHMYTYTYTFVVYMCLCL